jgi:hypothetical protein
VLALIAVSLVVASLEEVRERRRLLAALAAIGTPRRTFSLSVFYQTLIPITAAVALAVAGGLLLGSLLLVMADRPVQANPQSILVICTLAGAMIAATTIVASVALWRGAHPNGLQTE